MDNLTLIPVTNAGTVQTTFNIKVFLEDWLSYVDVKGQSAKTYTTATRQFTSWLTGKGIRNPQREDILAYRRDLENRGVKASTIQLYIVAIRQFFKWASSRGLCNDVADNIKGAKIGKDFKKDFLQVADIQKVLNAINRDTLTGKRDYALIALAVTAGLRTVELARANIGDINQRAGDDVLFVQGKGKDDKAEYVKLAEPVKIAIRDYLQARGELTADNPLFSATRQNAGDNGNRLYTESISRIIKTHFRNVGMNSDRLTAHSLRHTAATLNLLNGGTLEETRQMMRHTSINTTMIYNHAIERAKNNSEKRTAFAIFGGNL